MLLRASFVLALAPLALAQSAASVTTRTPHPEREDPAALERAAKAGDPVAATKLGIAYEYGWGVPHDAEQATKWFVEAAKEGEPHALMRLGRMFEVPEHGVLPDHRRARELFERAAAGGDPFATSRLHARGWREGGFEEALRWVRRAADAGDPLAFHYMWKYLEHGMGTAKDSAEAARWTLRGVERGDLRSLHLQGFALERQGQTLEAFVLQEEAADRGAPYAMQHLAERLYAGITVPQDLFAARALATRAALGESDAARLAGVLALRGLGGPRDPERGLALLRHGVGLDGDDAVAWMAWALAHGEGGLSPDPARARVMLEEAAKRSQDPHVRYHLARLLLHGLGGPADPSRARALLKGLEWPAAANDRAVLELLGRGGPGDQAAGRATLARVAPWCPAAATNLAFLLEGAGEPLQAGAARALWRFAADGGEPFAVKRVAELLASGELVARWSGEAALWAARAARRSDPPAPFVFADPLRRLRSAAEDAAWWREGLEAGSVQEGIELLRAMVRGDREAGQGRPASQLLERLRAWSGARSAVVLDEDGEATPLLTECALLEADLVADGEPGTPPDLPRARRLYAALKTARGWTHLGLREERAGNLDGARMAYGGAARKDPLSGYRLARVIRHMQRRAPLPASPARRR